MEAEVLAEEAAGAGGGLGGGTTDNSGFKLYVNYTSEIDALSPDIDTSIAVISRGGFIQTDTSKQVSYHLWCRL